MLSFTDYDFTMPDSTQWIGFGNYLKMFGSVFGLSEFTASTGEVMRVDPYYLKSLSVTFTYVFVSVPLKLIFALAVAMLLNQKLRGVPFYRAVYYIPTLLGGSVAIAVLWRKLFEKDGLVNGLLAAVGFTDLPGWITNPNYALWTLILLSVWQFGSSMIIFLAGLKQIHRSTTMQQAWTARASTAVLRHNHTLALASDSVQPGHPDDPRSRHSPRLISSVAAGEACSTPHCSIPSICIFRDGHITRWGMRQLWRGYCCSLSGCSRAYLQIIEMVGVIWGWGITY